MFLSKKQELDLTEVQAMVNRAVDERLESFKQELLQDVQSKVTRQVGSIAIRLSDGQLTLREVVSLVADEVRPTYTQSVGNEVDLESLAEQILDLEDQYDLENRIATKATEQILQRTDLSDLYEQIATTFLEEEQTYGSVAENVVDSIMNRMQLTISLSD